MSDKLADLIPVTWGIEIPEDMEQFAETFFTELSNRKMCRLFVDEAGKCVMTQDGKRQVMLTASVTPQEYIAGLPPNLIRKLFDNVAANAAFREPESRIISPWRN